MHAFPILELLDVLTHTVLQQTLFKLLKLYQITPLICIIMTNRHLNQKLLLTFINYRLVSSRNKGLITNKNSVKFQIRLHESNTLHCP